MFVLLVVYEKYLLGVDLRDWIRSLRAYGAGNEGSSDGEDWDGGD
jgi:hypothetical protein